MRAALAGVGNRAATVANATQAALNPSSGAVAAVGGGKTVQEICGPLYRSPEGKKRVISMSLFSRDGVQRPALEFTAGLMQFMRLKRQTFPQWQVRVYLPRQMDARYVQLLRDICVDVVLRDFSAASWMDGMFWRFHVADDPMVERWLVRDLDSRPHLRDAHSVEEWIQKDNTIFFLTRDHPYHGIPIVGCCLGGLGQLLKHTSRPNDTVEALCNAYPGKTIKGHDQDFLGQVIWPLVRDNCTQATLDGTCVHGGRGVCRKMPPGWKDQLSADGRHNGDGQDGVCTGCQPGYFVGTAYKKAFNFTFDCAVDPCVGTTVSYAGIYREITGRELAWNPF